VEKVILKIIDDYLRKRPKDQRAIRCFHPSSLHKPEEYLLKAYFEGDNGAEASPRVLRIFDNGKATHERLQKYLKEAGVLLQAEVPVINAEYEIRGSADGIVEIGGAKGVLEIKSINSQGFYGLFEPKAEHLMQINVYMFCSGIPRGVLLYENKNDQEIKEFLLKQDSGVLEPVLEKIRRVQKQIEKSVVDNQNLFSKYWTEAVDNTW
jgi:hypothetical protein